MALAPDNTYEQNGMVEDISDIIGLISPYDTPCYSQFRKVDAHNTLIQWQEDFLRLPAANKQLEINSPTTISDWDPTVMKNNNTQIFEESAEVTGTMAAVDLYGRTSEMDYQVMKKGRETRRDIEHALCGLVQTGSAGVVRVTERELKSMGTLVSDNTTFDGVTPGTAREFTEAVMLAAHQVVYQFGGDPNQLLVSPTEATVVAEWALAQAGGRSRQINNEGDETRLVNKVELILTPFGQLTVVIDRWVIVDNAFLLETDRWYLPVLRPMTSQPLAKIGDSERRLINCEMSVAVENGESSGWIRDLGGAAGTT